MKIQDMSKESVIDKEVTFRSEWKIESWLVGDLITSASLIFLPRTWSRLLFTAAQQGGYLDPHYIQEILGSVLVITERSSTYK